MYVDIAVSEDSPPLFRLSADENFTKPAYVTYMAVYSDKPGEKHIRWAIMAHRRKLDGFRVVDVNGFRVPLREIVYGVVPDGFREWSKTRPALPLEPDALYSLIVRGGVAGVGTIVHFRYKPGRYFGKSHR